MSDPKNPKVDESRVLWFANGSTLVFGPADVGDQFEGSSFEYMVIDCDDEVEDEPC